MLEFNSGPSVPNDTIIDPSPDEAAALQALAVAGRAKEIECADDDFDWSEWHPTDLGRLALRCCPLEEA